MAKKRKDEITIRCSAAEYLTFIASIGDNQQTVEMRYEDENLWLTQKMMALIYGVDVRTINYHIKKIFVDSELQKSSVIRKYWITADDEKSYYTNCTHPGLRMTVPQGRHFINRRCNLRTASHHYSSKSRRDDTYRILTYNSLTS